MPSGEVASGPERRGRVLRRLWRASDGIFARYGAAIQALSKIKNIRGQLERIHEQATAQGRNTQEIEREMGKVKDMQMRLAQLVVAS